MKLMAHMPSRCIPCASSKSTLLPCLPNRQHSFLQMFSTAVINSVNIPCAMFLVLLNQCVLTCSRQDVWTSNLQVWSCVHLLSRRVPVSAISLLGNGCFSVFKNRMKAVLLSWIKGRLFFDPFDAGKLTPRDQVVSGLFPPAVQAGHPRRGSKLRFAIAKRGVNPSVPRLASIWCFATVG